MGRFQSGVLPGHIVDTVTSAGTLAVLTIQLGYKPSHVELWTDTANVADVWKKWQNDTTNTQKIEGTSGIVSNVADASAITLTDDGFTVAIAAQVANGVNHYIAHR